MSTTSTSTKTNSASVPRFDVDLHSEEVLAADPYPIYAQMREAGPVVWLETYGYYALPRHAEVIAALGDWDTFTSEQGVGLNESFNAIRETSLMTHGDLHDTIKHIESRPIAPDQLKELQPRLRDFAEELVEDLVARRTVDGVTDIATKMPLEIVTGLVGLDHAGRDQLYTWGVQGFNSIGPMHASRTGPALETMAGYVEYAAQNIPGNIRPGGWADQLFANGRDAGWSEEFCRRVMVDYIYPSLDTTINAISHGLLLFAQHPDQWQRVREDRSLFRTAVPEIVRLASPVQYFTRVTTRDVEIGGATLPAGARVLIMFGSANRDEREFADPDTFDVGRGAGSQVGWGAGKHACMGMPLARMEMRTLFTVLADHVERFEVGEYSYAINNIIRGLGRLDLTLVPATSGR